MSRDGMSDRDDLKLLGLREYQAHGRAPDALECRVCGYVVARQTRDDYAGDGHPFHFDGCPWKETHPDRNVSAGEVMG